MQGKKKLKKQRVIDKSVTTGWRLQSIYIHIMLGNNLAKNIMSENKQRESTKISIFLVVGIKHFFVSSFSRDLVSAGARFNG